MTKTTSSAVLTAASLTAVLLLSAGCGHRAGEIAAIPPSNTAEICPAYVKMANLGHNKAGNARTETARVTAWAELVTATRATAEKANDPALKADLVTVADGMARIAAEPGDLLSGYDTLEAADAAYYAAVNAASDRLEVTCGPITGIV